jgi:hypothetical protein
MVATDVLGGAAVQLRDGPVLVIDGDNDSAELYDPNGGTFRATGSLIRGFAGGVGSQWSSVMRDGRVLILGDTGPITSAEGAEIYDPSTGKFSLAGSSPIEREDATITSLADGRVLIAGGIRPSDEAILTSAQIYNPATGKFTSTGSMASPRAGAVATRLHDGRVLISGGFDGGGYDGYYDDGTILASAETYDPHTGMFSKTGSMTTVRCYHVATLLHNGQVLVVGGIQSRGNDLATAELYDPSSGKFTKTGSMSVARQDDTATLLANGKVLIAGGENTDTRTLSSAELYDSAAGRFTLTGSMTVPRMNHTATLLSDGRVLITAGQNADGGLSSAEIYYP